MGCEHNGCSCRKLTVTRNDKKYCSETCAEIDATGRHQKHCPCGHAECAAT